MDNNNFFQRIINNIRKLCCCSNAQQLGPTSETQQHGTSTRNYEILRNEEPSRPVVPSHRIREDELNERRSQNERRIQIASSSTVSESNTSSRSRVYDNKLVIKVEKRRELPSVHRVLNTSEDSSAGALETDLKSTAKSFETSRLVVPSHLIRKDEVNERRSQNERGIQIASSSTASESNTSRRSEPKKIDLPLSYDNKLVSKVEKRKELPLFDRKTSLRKAGQRKQEPLARRKLDTSVGASANVLDEKNLEFKFPQSREQQLEKLQREISNIKDRQLLREENQVQQPKTITTDYKKFRQKQSTSNLIREIERFETELNSQIIRSTSIIEVNTSKDRQLKKAEEYGESSSFRSDRLLTKVEKPEELPAVHRVLNISDEAAAGILEKTYLKSTAESFREQAKEHLERRQVLKIKAKQLLKLGNRELANYFFQQVKEQTRLHEQANSFAAAAFLAYNQKRHPSRNTIDLHHLFVKEAIQALDVFLDDEIDYLQNSEQDSKQLTVITGRGKHSVDGIPKIKPAVVKRLIKRGLEYSKLNPGSLEVYISKYSSKSNVASGFQ